MGTSTQINRHYYFSWFPSEHQEGLARFEFNLVQPLDIGGRERLLIKECVLPRLKMKFDPLMIVLDGDLKLKAPSMYISNPFEVCSKLAWLMRDAGRAVPQFSWEKELKGGLKMTIPPSSKFEVSANVGDLLFQGKTHFENSSGQAIDHWFKVQGNYENETYYLTCDLLSRCRVNNLHLPLLNTMVVQKIEGETHSHLLWTNDEVQGKAMLREGLHRAIVLSILDRKGNIVQLKGGLFFIHLKICT
jgi:hypothetical protein